MALRQAVNGHVPHAGESVAIHIPNHHNGMPLNANDLDSDIRDMSSTVVWPSIGGVSARGVLVGSDHGRVHRQQLLEIGINALSEQARETYRVEDSLVGAVL